MPETLRAELLAAAAGYNLSALNQHLTTLAGHGEEARRLAEQLRGLVRRYDLAEVQRLLGPPPGDHPTPR